MVGGAIARGHRSRDRRETDTILGACELEGVPSSLSPQLTHRAFRSHFHHSFPSPSPDTALFTFFTPSDLSETWVGWGSVSWSSSPGSINCDDACSDPTVF